MKSPFKTVALVGKYNSPEVAGPLLELARFLDSRKVKVLIDQLTASQVPGAGYQVLGLDELGKQADLAITACCGESSTGIANSRRMKAEG